MNGLEELNTDITALEQIKSLQKDAKSQLQGCKASLDALESAKAKLDAEVRKIEAEDGAIDHLANLAKSQRNRARGSAAAGFK